MFVNMLGFAPAYKRIALAPSVAIQELNETEKAEFKKFLSPFRCLSCREKQGAALITSITSKKCVSLIDPVFMVTRDQWASIEKKPVFHEEKKYILLYFLGNITGEYRMIIDTISKTYGLEVIDLLDTESKYYQSGPAEFIYLIHHCAIILTDSFHGSAFSYIFNKPFRIFRRKDNLLDMNSRLVNLMDILHLDDSIYIGSDVDYDKLFDVHYDQSYFEAEKAAFTEYLKNAFGGV